MGAIISGAVGAAAVTAGSGSLGDWVKDKLNEIYEYTKFWYIVDHSEEAVILRFGKWSRNLKPGYHLKFPIIEVGHSAHTKPDTLEIESICITTLDGKTIMIGLGIGFDVIDIKKFLWENTDSPSNMKDAMRMELSDYLEDMEWTAIRKKTTKNAIIRNLQKYFDTLGVRILDLKYTNKSEVRAYKIFNEQSKNKEPQSAFL